MQSVVAGSRVLQDLVNAIYIYGHWPVLIIAGASPVPLPPRPVLHAAQRVPAHRRSRAIHLRAVPGRAAAADRPAAVDTVTHGARATGRSSRRRSSTSTPRCRASTPAGTSPSGSSSSAPAHHWALRVFAVLMPVAMAFAVIATANHFVIDVIVGVTLVLMAFGLQHVSVVPRRTPCRIPGRRSGTSCRHPPVHGHD